MKSKAYFALPILITVLVCNAIVGCTSQPSSSSVRTKKLKAGLATVDITPGIGYRMAGYFDERCSTGVHDPLNAKAMVLQEGQNKIAIVSCDLVGVPLTVTKPAREQASAKCGIPVSNIVICGTHSHTGPLYNDLRNSYFHQAQIARHGFDVHQPVDYADVLIPRLVQVIEQANKNLKPATLAAGIARQEGISFNRRYHMKDGTVRFNPGLQNPNIVRPAGPIDPEVGLLSIRDRQNKPVGGLTVFALHPDTTGGTLFSADYPYYLSESLKKSLGSNYVSLFGLGTAGDINHIDVSKAAPVKDFSNPEHCGSSLGQTVLNSLGSLKPVENPSFAVRSKTITSLLRETSQKEIDDARAILHLIGTTNLSFGVKVEAVRALDIAQRGKECPMEVQVMRLDSDTALVCLPAEIFADLGLAIKKQSPFKTTIVMTICNDRPSYVPTTKAFGEGSYEIINARVQPGTGEKLVETALELLQQVR